MALKSSTTHYGLIPVLFHWTTAILIAIMIALGLNAEAATGDLKRTLLVPHIALGILTLLVTLARIAWWAFADKKPATPEGTPKVQARLSCVVHVLLYGFILALAASGIATNIVAGLLPALASGAPLPSLEGLAPRNAHAALAWGFMAFLALHIAAALYHQLVRRDHLLARMGIGPA